MGSVLILLLIAAVYAAFRLVKPEKNCPGCSGWGHRTRRRRTSACPRCRGTGKTFCLTARLVHKGAGAAHRQFRKRTEGK